MTAAIVPGPIRRQPQAGGENRTDRETEAAVDLLDRRFRVSDEIVVTDQHKAALGKRIRHAERMTIPVTYHLQEKVAQDRSFGLDAHGRPSANA